MMQEIAVDWPSLTKALKGRAEHKWLSLTGSNIAPEAFADLVMECCISFAGDDGYSPLLSGFVDLGGRYVFALGYTDGTQAVALAHRIVDTLSAREAGGALERVRTASSPLWVDDCPNALFGLGASATSQTEVVSRLTENLDDPNRQRLLRMDGFRTALTRTDSATRTLITASRTASSFGLNWLDRTKRARRSLQQTNVGFWTMTDFEENLAPRTQLTRLQATAMTAPEVWNVYFIRSGLAGSLSWELIGYDAFPHTRPSDLTYKPELLASYSPDAHGFQILRAAHLERARDLSSWTVTEVAQDRFTVEHHDLEAWYAEITPPTELQADARHDFGDMILTQEVLARQ